MTHWQKKTLEADKKIVAACLAIRFEETKKIKDAGEKFLALQRLAADAGSEEGSFLQYIEDRTHWGRGKTALCIALGIGTLTLYPLIRGPFDGPLKRRELKKHTDFINMLDTLSRDCWKMADEISTQQLDALGRSPFFPEIAKKNPDICQNFALAAAAKKQKTPPPKQRGLNF